MSIHFHLWVPEWGETEEDAREILGVDAKNVVSVWATKQDTESIVPDGEAVAVHVRGPHSGHIFRVRAVASVDYYVEETAVCERGTSG